MGWICKVTRLPKHAETTWRPRIFWQRARPLDFKRCNRPAGVVDGAIWLTIDQPWYGWELRFIVGRFVLKVGKRATLGFMTHETAAGKYIVGKNSQGQESQVRVA